MGKFDAPDSVRNRAGLAGGRKYLERRHIKELSGGIDEAADEPRTGNAIDLWPLARDPFVGRHANFLVRRQFLRPPSCDAAGQISGVHTGLVQFSRRRLTALGTVSAIEYDRPVFRQIF